MSQRSIGLPVATALVMGSMIGSGIFLLPSTLARYGAISIGGWLCAALGALSLAWIFARFSQWRPGLGGPYFYSREGLGDLAGFLVAWGYWISIWTGNSAIAVAAVSYLTVFVPSVAANSLISASAAVSVVWLLTFVNLQGVREAGIVQLVTTVLKATPLLLLGVGGLFALDPAQFEPVNRSAESIPGAIAATTALCLWAFLGLEAATIPSENIAEPTATIPRATFLGVAMVALIYVLGSTAVLGVVPHDQLVVSTAPFAAAAGLLWGPGAALVIAAAAVASTLGALNGLILLGGQMPMAASRDGLFPPLFGRRNSRDVPAAGMLLSAALTSVLVASRYTSGLVGLFKFSILLSTAAVLVPYLFSAAAAFRLRHELGVAGRWFGQATIGVAFLFSMWAVGGAGQEAVYWGVFLIIAGLPVFAWQQSRNGRQSAPK